jgi:HAD superfamily hydrolase (TIGR01509 family)
MVKGIIFDMDGVLLDSEHLTSQAAINYFANKGFTVKHEDFIPFFGTGEEGFFGGVASKYGIPYDNCGEAGQIYLEYAKLARENIGPLPGVKVFIELCKSRNIKLAVATSAMRLKLDINLELLGFESNTFDALVCGSDIVKNKPDPEIFITALEKLGIQPGECIVVEDSPSGVLAAKSAGMKCLALLTSFSPEQLKAADWIKTDLKEYPKEIFITHNS